MNFVVDMFFSFRSPYSYLALTKTRAMVNAYAVDIRLRPVYPIAVRIPNFFKQASPNFAQYVYLDSARVALREGIPFRLPRPDPVVQDMTTLEIAPEQPYIRRLTRLGSAAQAEGCSLEFAETVAPVLWDGSTDG
jgi:2-hydroxychromene-2-carboxylate isomerase